MKNHLNNTHRPSYKLASQLLSCLAVICFAAMHALPVHAAAEDKLSSERWESRGEGLSLQLPLSAQTLQLSGDDAILRIGHPDGYKATLYIKKSTRDLSLDEVVRSAIDQASRTPTTVRKIQDPFDIKLDTLDAKGFTFAAPDVTPPVVLVQVFAMLNERKVLIIELNADPRTYENARVVFDQMLASVRFKEPEKLLEERKAELEAGRKWLETITPEMIHKATAGKQWFRMMDDKTDIGYMRIEQTQTSAMNRKGVRLDIQSRIVIGNQAYDTLSNYFASDEMDPALRTEIWSVRTTSRAREGIKSRNAASADETSWAETGVLSKGKLMLNRESPQEKKPYEWSTLPQGYITQVLSQLLPALLGPADKGTLAFYAYYGNTGKISLRTERVETASDGSYKVFSRPSPEQQEQVSWYDNKGKLIRRVLPGGQVLQPAAANEIVTRWQLKQ